MRELLTALALFAAVPAVARAQTATRPVARADLAASIGWFAADHPLQSGCCPWSSGLFKGLQTGYYWDDHLKTEVEVAASGETEVYAYGPFETVPVGSYSSDRHAYHDFLVSGMQVYQFGRNAYFHPFVGAGVDLDRERHRIEHTVRTGATAVITESTDTRVLARPFIAAGFKAYGSERLFFRTDLKAAFRNGFDQVTWKLGFGIDF